MSIVYRCDACGAEFDRDDDLGTVGVVAGPHRDTTLSDRVDICHDCGVGDLNDRLLHEIDQFVDEKQEGDRQ